MGKKIGWGIVGPGHIAEKFASDLALIPNCELRAVASRDMDRASSFAREYGAKKAYASYKELFADSEVEVVYIATPHSFHHAHTLAALGGGGKHVLCEKPLGINVAEVQQMTDLAAKKGLFLMEALWSRFNPSIREVHERVKNGELGSVAYLRADFAFPALDRDPDGRLLNPALAGGSLLDIGIYPVFLAYLFLGMPDEIKVSAHFHHTGVEKQIAMIFDYKDALAVLYSGFSSKNEDQNKLALADLRKRYARIRKGGGEKRIQKLHGEGKMTARERIEYLLDDPEQAIEIGAFAGFGMYEEYGGCPSGGVVVKIGHIRGRLCVVVANDATVKAGAWFPITGKKNLRAQEIAMDNHLPIIYLVDSAGVFLPMQDEIFPDKEHFGRIFRNNAQMSSRGIPQIAAVMGSCVAGGAYLPIMSDEALIVDKTGSIFLAGSYLVKAAIGESVDNETLGGATTHCEISGVTDYKAIDDKDALDRIKNLIDKMGAFPKAGFNRVEPAKPARDPKEIYGLLPGSRSEPYDMLEIIERLVDDSSFEQYKEGYGKTLLTGYARIDGWAVGIVANQRRVVKTKKGEMQFGGVIYSDSADKATRFIANCNQKKIPLIFLQDVTGFMVGSQSEHGGIIKDGAKMVNAVSNSVVPKFTVVIGNSYGAGNYAMCGKAYDPRLMIAWPSANLAVMSGKSAAKVLLQIEKARLQKSGESFDADKEAALYEEIKQKYDTQISPYYAAARLWTDAIIDPVETRRWISTGIEAADHAPIEKPFNMGVLQV